MARYMGRIDVCRITIPLPAVRRSPSPGPTSRCGTIVDEHVQAKWQAPEPDAQPAGRRRYVPAAGRSSTRSAPCRRPRRSATFLADPASAEKRSTPGSTRSWRGASTPTTGPSHWGDLLRNQRKGQRDNQRGTYAFHAWIRNALATNMPYDQFVRGIIAAQGTVDQHPPVIWYRTVRNLTHQTNDTAQLFLGTRINCAQCHNHPYEKWTQTDYYQLPGVLRPDGQEVGRERGRAGDLRPSPTAQCRHPATRRRS